MDKSIAGRDKPTPFERDLVALMPALRRFSYSLCRDSALAADMAQQALMKAWRSQENFKAGTNLQAWIFTILRNEFFSHRRRAWREAHWDAGVAEQIPAPPNEQEWTLNLSDANRALGTLPQHQREALILVGAGGFSYEDAAKLSGTRVGTIKSRVTRGRIGLSKRLGDGTMPPRESGYGRSTAPDDVLVQLSALSAGGAMAAVHV